MCRLTSYKEYKKINVFKKFLEKYIKALKTLCIVIKRSVHNIHLCQSIKHNILLCTISLYLKLILIF